MKKIPMRSITPLVDDDGDEKKFSTDNPKGLMLKTLGVVEPGLVVVTVPNGHMLPHVRTAFEREILTGGQKTGLRFPKCTTVKSLYGGNERKVSQAKALALAQRPSEGSGSQEFASIGTREGFNLACDEGLCAVLPNLEQAKGGCLTFAQSGDASSAASLAEAMMRLRQAAKQSRSFMMLILVTERRPDELRLGDYCDDVVVTAACIPDPGVMFAFSADVVGLRDLNEMGIGKMMCSLRIHKGPYVWSWEPFIAADVLKRVIWKLRCSGKSLAEIGKIVDCDKSTVHRHMVGLPPVVKREFKEGWLKPYADLIEIAIESDENPESDEDS